MIARNHRIRPRTSVLHVPWSGRLCGDPVVLFHVVWVLPSTTLGAPSSTTLSSRVRGAQVARMPDLLTGRIDRDGLLGEVVLLPLSVRDNSGMLGSPGESDATRGRAFPDGHLQRVYSCRLTVLFADRAGPFELTEAKVAFSSRYF